MISDFGYAAMLNNIDKMRFFFWRRLLGVLFCIMWLPPGTSSADRIDPDHAESAPVQNNATVVRQYKFMVAENNRSAEDQDGTESASGEDPEQKPATDSESRPAKQKSNTDSVKSFEPTEKVKAEQAVDFPYDI